MKKIIPVFVIMFSLILSLCAPAYAAMMNVNDEIDSIINYYSKSKTEVKEWDEIVAFSAVNAIQGNVLDDPDLSKETPVETAKFLFKRMSLKIDLSKEVKGEDPVKLLASGQMKDGSFYEDDLYSNVLCFIALEGCESKEGEDTILYSAKKAVDYIISKQDKDGKFSEDFVTHCLAVSYLSAFLENNTEVTASIDKAAEYIQNKENDKKFNEAQSTKEISFAIIALVDSKKADDITSFAKYGNLPDKLLYRKNSDSSYRATAEKGDADKESSLSALMAYDAISDSKSIYRSFCDFGAVNENMFHKLKWVIIIFIALVVLSVIFWCYILFGRKKEKVRDEK